MCQLWRKFYDSFHGSEVIIWSRLQVFMGSVWVFLGLVWAGLQGVDLGVLFNDHPEYLVYYIIFSNVVNEWLRRRRAEWKEEQE